MLRLAHANPSPWQNLMPLRYWGLWNTVDWTCQMSSVQVEVLDCCTADGFYNIICTIHNIYIHIIYTIYIYMGYTYIHNYLYHGMCLRFLTLTQRHILHYPCRETIFGLSCVVFQSSSIEQSLMNMQKHLRYRRLEALVWPS